MRRLKRSKPRSQKARLLSVVVLSLLAVPVFRQAGIDCGFLFAIAGVAVLMLATEDALHSLYGWLRWTLTDPSHLYDLGPAEFERYVTWLLRRRGYRSRCIGGPGDGGIDVYVYKPGGQCAAVQCKRYRPGTYIGPDVVRDLRGAMVREGIYDGYIVTTANFSEGACREAGAVPNYRIRLVDGATLMRSDRQAKRRRR